KSAGHQSLVGWMGNLLPPLRTWRPRVYQPRLVRARSPMALDANETPQGQGKRHLGCFFTQCSPAKSPALARWSGRTIYAGLDPHLPVPSRMGENASLRLAFWRAGCVTKGARPVRK